MYLRPLVRQQLDKRHDSACLNYCAAVLLGERQHLDLSGGCPLLPCRPIAQLVDRVAEDEHRWVDKQCVGAAAVRLVVRPRLVQVRG